MEKYIRDLYSEGILAEARGRYGIAADKIRLLDSFESLWLREIPAFLKLREIDLYAIICRDFDVDHIEHRWTAEFMRGRKEKIENDVPYLDVYMEVK